MAGIEKKKEPNYGYNSTGIPMSEADFEDDSGRDAIGMHIQEDSDDLEHSAPPKMKRGKNPKPFDNNGGESKADGAGTVDHNAEYGNITYGF